MTTDDEAPASTEAPEPLIVRYNRQVHSWRLLAILALAAMCLIIPFAAEGPIEDSWRFAGVLIAAALIWAVVTVFRLRDRSPQVLIDENGVFFREWLVGTIPWENIQFIAHSSQVRRGIVASITRTRKKPYLMFKFIELPKVRPTAPIPFKWLQFVRAEFAIQEPILQQYGLDTPVNDILASIQQHIAHWQTEHDILEDEQPGQEKPGQIPPETDG
ncbi:MAG: hypothetical protein HOL07_02590 [Rhodospirillaceae bacterium]|nr:hypothetical protein [Rhodospirillaceae bacterium]MBT3810069.1 hypothetical protein [Rhodospirillaceae bacterium]MBT3930377.1 hypothetical protein [Rhodospirillaceae bacterium]MBT4772052.1 hypothetical protein [Rhodospirillaceae bacterium]MBT5357207.1 hypothetical protein [Rhodospirillaceae bacterium]